MPPNILLASTQQHHPKMAFDTVRPKQLSTNSQSANLQQPNRPRLRAQAKQPSKRSLSCTIATVNLKPRLPQHCSKTRAALGRHHLTRRSQKHCAPTNGSANKSPSTQPANFCSKFWRLRCGRGQRDLGEFQSAQTCCEQAIRTPNHLVDDRFQELASHQSRAIRLPAR